MLAAKIAVQLRSANVSRHRNNFINYKWKCKSLNDEPFAGESFKTERRAKSVKFGDP